MEYMFSRGFLGTQAPFFMDMMAVLIFLLPFSLYLGVLIAKRGWYDLHRWYQWILFFIALIIIGWFEYGIRLGGGVGQYSNFDSQSIAFKIYLGLHILIAIVSLYLWVRTLALAQRNFKERNLPGGYTLRHIRNAWVTFGAISLTSLTGGGLYLILFVL